MILVPRSVRSTTNAADPPTRRFGPYARRHSFDRHSFSFVMGREDRDTPAPNGPEEMRDVTLMSRVPCDAKPKNPPRATATRLVDRQPLPGVRSRRCKSRCGSCPRSSSPSASRAPSRRDRVSTRRAPRPKPSARASRSNTISTATRWRRPRRSCPASAASSTMTWSQSRAIPSTFPSRRSATCPRSFTRWGLLRPRSATRGRTTSPCSTPSSCAATERGGHEDATRPSTTLSSFGIFTRFGVS
mmetsp:Transcript_14383/g.57245  ORF Transcript_14383/g.57245 Transcript_14383/m.57245 type:complete len:244 (+) Transcript_14383:236-967(+)